MDNDFETHVVPAAPGWYLALPVVSEENTRVMSVRWSPIVGWRFDFYDGTDEPENAVALALFGLGTSLFPQVIKRPDGLIDTPVGTHEDGEWLLEFFTEQLKWICELERRAVGGEKGGK